MKRAKLLVSRKFILCGNINEEGGENADFSCVYERLNTDETKEFADKWPNWRHFPHE
jgi:hypothetical protein